MPTPLAIAYKCAPVICQKVNSENPRGDFITRIDFTKKGDLTSLVNNWSAVNDPHKTKSAWKTIETGQIHGFTFAIEPYVYYSVVETHTHYFIMYAVYHAQDWELGETARRSNGPKWYTFKTEHEHDMEGALVVATKREPFERLRADAMITISHFWFYTYANWWLTNSRGKLVRVFPKGKEDRYTGSRVNRETRPKIYVQAKGHGIRGDKTDWSGGDRIIYYCPSLKGADEPSFRRSDGENPKAKLLHKNSPDDKDGKPVTDSYRYGLIDIFEPNTGSTARGLWASRDDERVFKVDGKGQDCFVKHGTGGVLEPGDARPPWSWDDLDDAHTSGELALQPAHIVYDYLGGIREFSLEYVRNPYLGI
jgi:hypothetical protein